MKINKKQSKEANLIITIVILLLVGLVAGYIYFKSQPQPIVDNQTSAQTIDYNPPTAEQKQAGEDQKLSTQKPISTKFTAAITSANTNGEIVQIRSVINGAISNEGVCDLTLTNGAETVSKSTATYAMPSSSTCQGFDINRSELSSGTWQINLTATINGEIATASSEIKLE